MGVLIRSAWAMLRQRFARPVRAAVVRDILREQAGIAAVELVTVEAARAGGCQVSVRIRFAEGSDAREATQHAVEALCETLPITEIRVFALGAEEAPRAGTTHEARRE